MEMRRVKEDDSGAAFPLADMRGWSARGMTIRDYFAARAMQALIAARPNFKPETLSSTAYELADEMLRVKRDGYLVPEWKEPTT
jgi:hypothetical protein